MSMEATNTCICAKVIDRPDDFRTNQEVMPALAQRVGSDHPTFSLINPSDANRLRVSEGDVVQPGNECGRTRLRDA